MTSLTLDLRFVLRSLAKRPLFALLSILTLALGLGANTVIFSFVDAVLFRPLPFPDPDRLVRVWPESYFSKEEFLALQERSASYEGLAAYFSWGVYGLAEGDEPEAVRAAHVSPELFPVLGLPPSLGRTFQPGEDAAADDSRVVLSHGLWQRRFGGDPEVVGSGIRLDGERYTVIGVMPSGFGFPQTDTEIWVPMRFDPTDDVDFRSGYVQLVARLQPGVTCEAAQAEGRAAAASMREVFDYPRDYGVASTVQPLHRVMVGDVRPAMLTLLAAVGLVLLIAAANVANLLLTRAAGRSREVAVRAALGAGRGRIIRLLLLESLLLALVGGGLGLVGAVLGLDAAVALLPADLPRLHEIGVDGRLFGFSMAMASLTGLLFGLLPALQASKPGLFDSLRESVGSSGSASRSRLSGLLVVSEVALALVLVVGAGLLIKSFWRLTRVDPGFEPASVVSFYPILPSVGYGDFDREKRFYSQVMERLEALPGVEAAGGVHMLPVGSWGFNGGFETEDHPVPPGASAPIVNWRVVTPGYFNTLGIPMLQGRALAAADRQGSQQVALVNRTLADRFWPGESPVGKRIQHSLDGGEEVTIVGVVGDVRQHGLASDVAAEIYRPLAQNQRQVSLNFVLRAAGEPEPLFAAVRAATASVDPRVPVSGLRTMEQVIHRSVAQPRLMMRLVALFAAVAMILGAIGIYGVMAQDVSRRIRELGLRMALGARRRDVFGLVMKRSLLLVAAGIVIGLGASSMLARFLTSVLFGVRLFDPPLYLAVALLLGVVAAMATIVPARRATGIDPLSALRHD